MSQEQEISFEFSAEKQDDGRFILFFGKNQIMDGYALGALIPEKGEDSLATMVVTAMNEAPSLMHEIEVLREERDRALSRIQELEKENQLKSVI
jgi:hypothetical protein